VAKKNKPTAGWQTNHSGKDTKAEDNGPSGWPGSGCERGLGRLDGDDNWQLQRSADAAPIK